MAPSSCSGTVHTCLVNWKHLKEGKIHQDNHEYENGVLFSDWRRQPWKTNPSAPIMSRTYDLPITSSDALPLSYRRFVGARPLNREIFSYKLKHNTLTIANCKLQKPYCTISCNAPKSNDYRGFFPIKVPRNYSRLSIYLWQCPIFWKNVLLWLFQSIYLFFYSIYNKQIQIKYSLNNVIERMSLVWYFN